MTIQASIRYAVLIFSLCGLCRADFDARQETVRLMEKAGWEHLLNAPVRLQCAADKPVAIIDEGVFIVQHTILTPEVGAVPNVIVEGADCLPPKADKLLVAVHGWLDRGQTGWPGKVAEAVRQRVDADEWVCASYDWKGGAVVVSSIMAAEYARDIAGPRLAAGVLGLDRPFTHIHLVGHSAGSWAIHSAAKRLAEEYPNAAFHLTFLDAYVPSKWNPDELGKIFADAEQQTVHCWAEHYYTRDITCKATGSNLKYAHNVNITSIAPILGDHEFPYRWYLATITGTFTRWSERWAPVVCLYDGLDYGFGRSLEAGTAHWQTSLTLSIGKPAMIVRKNVSQ